MKKLNKKILISTGGTGGHVFPAYSLAQYLTNQDYSIEIVTDTRGMKFLKNSTINLKLINTSTIFQKNPFKVVYSFFQITFALIKSFLLLINSKPSLVFGMGGYSSFPICLAAKLLRIPFIIYENNLLLGKANKFLLPMAHKLFVSYSDLEGLKSKYNFKKFKIGNLIREKILNFQPNKELLKSGELSILILGGSQAARSFAEKIPNIVSQCTKEKIKLKLFQQCLKDQNLELEKLYKSQNIEFKLFNFSENLLDYFSKVDLAITRAGSSMIAELINCNIPFISIPFPYSAEEHQLKNAKYFEKKGYGFLIEEQDIELKLFTLIKMIHKDKNLLIQIKEKQKNHSDKSVFKKVDMYIKEIISE